MAFGTKILGAATLVFAFSSGVHAETLATANAFACGVDTHNIGARAGWGTSRASLKPASHSVGGADRDLPSTVKLRIVYEFADRIEVDHCGGTVIDSKWIVTAAHCVAADSSWDRIEIIAGNANLDHSKVRRVSKNAVCHSGFEYEGLKDDIALIRLDDPLPAHIPPAKIDQQGATSARRGATGIVAGWPVTGHRSGDRKLNKTQVRLTDVRTPGYITAVSASGAAAGVCRGESGGPLMAYGSYGLQLAGVLSGIQPGTEDSRGGECRLPGYEMYFTPIASFRNWLENVRGVCDRNPALCTGSGARGMLLASAPAYNGEISDQRQAMVAKPAYTPVAQTPMAYTPAPLSTPIQQSIAVVEPLHTPAPQILYQSSAPVQPKYIDVTAQYQSSAPVYSKSITQTYPSYEIALVDTVPVRSTPNYIDLGYIDVSSSYAPAASDYSHHTAPSHNGQSSTAYHHVGDYDAQSFSVAFVTETISVESMFLPHAW